MLLATSCFTPESHPVWIQSSSSCWPPSSGGFDFSLEAPWQWLLWEGEGESFTLPSTWDLKPELTACFYICMKGLLVFSELNTIMVIKVGFTAGLVVLDCETSRRPSHPSFVLIGGCLLLPATGWLQTDFTQRRCSSGVVSGWKSGTNSLIVIKQSGIIGLFCYIYLLMLRL